MSETTYARTGDAGHIDAMIVKITDGETQITYLTDGAVTSVDPNFGDGEKLRSYLIEMESDGYVKQS